jgi:uncharacterized protein with beta-barrel porin domain
VITTVNRNNQFILRELLRLQDEFSTGGMANCQGVSDQFNRKPKNKDKSRRYRKSVYTPTLASRSEEYLTPSQMIAGPILAAAGPTLGFTSAQGWKKSKQTVEKNHRPWRVFFGPTGNIGKVNNTHKQLGGDFSTLGGLFGFDYSFSQVAVGMYVDYDYVNCDINKHYGHFMANQGHAHAFMTVVPRSTPHFAMNLIAGAGGSWYSIKRNINTPTLKTATKAHTRGAEVDGLFGMQYMFAQDKYSSMPCNFEVIPFVNAQYVYAGIGGYKEKDGGIADLKFYRQGYQSLRSTVGMWLQYTAHRGKFSFTPMIDLAWQREYLDTNHNIYTQPLKVQLPKRATRVYGAGRDTGLAGIDFMFMWGQGVGLEMSYDFEYNRMYHNHAVFAGLNIRF